MIKLVPIAEKFQKENFLLSRAMAFISENLAEKTVPIDFSEYLFVLPTQEAGRLFKEKAAIFFQQYGGVTQLEIALPEQLLFDRSSINYSDIQSINNWCEILRNIDPAELLSQIFPEIEYTQEILVAQAEIFSEIRENIVFVTKIINIKLYLI